eukprot:g5166.t1
MARGFGRLGARRRGGRVVLGACDERLHQRPSLGRGLVLVARRWRACASASGLSGAGSCIRAFVAAGAADLWKDAIAVQDEHSPAQFAAGCSEQRGLEAQELLNELSEASQSVRPDVVTYNSVIAACERAWKWTTALHLFTVMRKDRDAYESCGNACSWTLCGEWPRPSSLGPGLCKEPRSNCIREEFLGNLHLLSLEEREPLWIYFAGDSTGRQLWAAFLKDVANINLGNTKDAERLKVSSISCNSLLSAFEKGTQWTKALALLQQMGRWRLQTQVSLCAVASACEKSWQWRRALLHLVGAPDAVSYSVSINAWTRLAVGHGLPHGLQATRTGGPARLWSCSGGTREGITMAACDLNPERDEVFSEIGGLGPMAPMAVSSAIAALSSSSRWELASSLWRPDVDAAAVLDACYKAGHWRLAIDSFWPTSTLGLLAAAKACEARAPWKEATAARRPLEKALFLALRDWDEVDAPMPGRRCSVMILASAEIFQESEVCAANGVFLMEGPPSILMLSRAHLPLLSRLKLMRTAETHEERAGQHVVEDTFLRQVDSLGRLTRTSLLHLGAAPFPLPASTREPGEGDGGRWGVRIGKLRRLSLLAWCATAQQVQHVRIGLLGDCGLVISWSAPSAPSSDLKEVRIEGQSVKSQWESNWQNRTWLGTILPDLKDEKAFESRRDAETSAGPTGVRFAVVGDLGVGLNGSAVLQRIHSEYSGRSSNSSVAGVLHLGDLANNLSSQDGARALHFLEMLEPSVPFMTLPGDRDTWQIYQRLFRTSAAPDQGPWYSFTAGSAKVIMLWTEAIAEADGAWKSRHQEAAERQRRWLEEELRKANTLEARALRPWVIGGARRGAPGRSTARCSGPPAAVRRPSCGQCSNLSW